MTIEIKQAKPPRIHISQVVVGCNYIAYKNNEPQGVLLICRNNGLGFDLINIENGSLWADQSTPNYNYELEKVHISNVQVHY